MYHGYAWLEPDSCSSATTTAARPLRYPIDRSISPIRSTKTTPIAITVTWAICGIRLSKLTAVKNTFVFAVKKIVIRIIPTITGSEPTSPAFSASMRRRTAVPSPSSPSGSASILTSSGAASLIRRLPAPGRRT